MYILGERHLSVWVRVKRDLGDDRVVIGEVDGVRLVLGEVRHARRLAACANRLVFLALDIAALLLEVDADGVVPVALAVFADELARARREALRGRRSHGGVGTARGRGGERVVRD